MTSQPMAEARPKEQEAVLRRRLVVRCALLLVLSGPVGFAAGMLMNSNGRVVTGIWVAATVFVGGVVTLWVVLRRERRRAARFGLTLSRYVDLGRLVRRGDPPVQAEVRPAVLEILERQRASWEQMTSKGHSRLRIGLIALFLLITVGNLLDRQYALAFFSSFALLCWLSMPLGLRRHRKRLEAAQGKLARNP
ncbi:hypothetical protein [Streptomyces sp. YS415]|uniref:hypothetical protein n=1 Tax=Streptomyces sp. YS415 TaxID=2944806 RepID=UPI002021FE30|nr:hypothetical protein [Streptomyces sp. YS415]MCL7430528.1 hypothetical protein [Streptomyces sp. YS415]